MFALMLASTAANVAAHHGHHDLVPAPEVQTRAASGARCATLISKRYAAMHKREKGVFSELLGKFDDSSTFFKSIQNSTCVLTPTVIEDPYWILGEQVRNDITEDRQSKPLVLGIGILNLPLLLLRSVNAAAVFIINYAIEVCCSGVSVRPSKTNNTLALLLS